MKIENDEMRKNLKEKEEKKWAFFVTSVWPGLLEDKVSLSLAIKKKRKRAREREREKESVQNLFVVIVKLLWQKNVS